MFLGEKRAELGRRVRATLLAAVGRLAAFPEMGWPLPDRPNTRELFVQLGGSSYVVRCRRTPKDEVFILRVWHSRERRA